MFCFAPLREHNEIWWRTCRAALALQCNRRSDVYESLLHHCAATAAAEQQGSGRFWLLDGIRRAPKEKGQSGRNRLRCSFSELQAQRIFSPSQQASMKCVLSS